MKILKYILLLSVMLSAMACESVDSQRIPALNVNIDLSNAGLWNTYGVSGYGMCRIFDREQRIPDNFAYTERTFTGYGGVMLVYGINGPVAYDRACPVEVSRKAVLYFDSSTLERGRRSARKRTGAREPLRAATAFGCACRRRISDYSLIENFLSFYNYCLR